MVVAKDAQRCGVEIQPSSFARLGAKPPIGHDPEDIAVCEQKHVSGATADSSDHAVGSRSDVGDGLAVRAAVVEQMPCRTVRSNLRRSSTLVLAVIPLDQIGIFRGDSAEAGEFTVRLAR
jgi:hypothetical protein